VTKQSGQANQRSTNTRLLPRTVATVAIVFNRAAQARTWIAPGTQWGLS